jgi:hypothetical protein
VLVQAATPLQPATDAVDEATTELFTELATDVTLAADEELAEVAVQEPRLDHALAQAQPTPGS